MLAGHEAGNGGYRQACAYGPPRPRSTQQADLSDSAHGYREGRSAQGAVEEVHRALRDGYTDVVDADLSKYFDTIPHDQLMKSVARRVSDGKMLRLIKAWLKTPVEETDERGNRSISTHRREAPGLLHYGRTCGLPSNLGGAWAGHSWPAW